MPVLIISVAKADHWRKNFSFIFTLYALLILGRLHMSGLSKVMIIRHGEKPLVKDQAPYGVTADGEEDWKSLTVQGWQRAGALRALFAPLAKVFSSDALAKPTVIFASNALEAKSAQADPEGSNSKRPSQTVTPLASWLELTPNLSFGKGDEAALVADVLTQTGVVLIAWQHERIVDIAGDLVKSGPPLQPIPQKWPDNRFDLVWVFDPPVPPETQWTFVQVPQMLLKGDIDTILT
jgi:hypothetical protein